MADPYFFKSAPVDILLGACYFYDIIKPCEIIKINDSMRLLNTIFGWVVGGGNTIQGHEVRTHSVVVEDLNKIENTLHKFWEIEELNNESLVSQDDEYCEKLYKETTRQDVTGRFIIKLPFRNQIPDLGNSFYGALKRFHSIENKFVKNEEFKTLYHDFMAGYFSSKHVAKIPFSEVTITKDSYYLPHLGVEQLSANIKKVRVVFNASFKTSNGKSLNNELLTGPKLQSDIRVILMRFRIHKYVFSTDVEKMFRQILVTDEDTKYLRFLWRSNTDEPIAHCYMCTLPFGLDCSPFLAERTMQELANREAQNFPEAARVLRENRYVDDIYSGADTIEETIWLRDQLRDLMSKGQFPLKKWVANHSDVLQDLDEIDSAHIIPMMSQDDFLIKALGLFWSPASDCFTFKITLPKIISKTKREFLSESARIFDPLGLASPTTVLIKQLFQELWTHKVNWDDKLPDNLLQRWIQLRNELPLLESIKIPRWIGIKGVFEIHGFSDASEKAYGAVVYLKSIDNNGVSNINLLLAKTKVAPLKTQTIPRLELCAAQMLAEAVTFVSNSLSITISKTFCYSDSQVVLAWLKHSPSELKTFVANRVANIKRLLGDLHWFYVRSKDNPADICSRGIFPSLLIDNTLWWKGPQWLSESCGSDLEFIHNPSIIIPELKKVTSNNLCSKIDDFPLVNKFSDLHKLLRVTAYCLRFGNILKQPRTEQISILELEQAMIRLIKHIQSQYYLDTIQRLSDNKPLKQKDRLLEFSPILDSDGVLRIGGRLNNAPISFDTKHPIILPKDSYLSTLLIRMEHVSSNHIGSQTVAANLRRKYWIVNSRSLIRKIIFECMVCYRSKPKPCNQLMGSLPASRVTPSRPFSKTGIDYAGPFDIRPFRRRGIKTFKCYVALFVCLTTKAIHLEVVTDLTSDACLAAVNRFSSRRGRPKIIITDNGTNFVGAEKYLDTSAEILRSVTFNDEMIKHLLPEQIDWKFIPARAPEFGGLWEASVKSCKSCLKKYMNDAKFTLEEFNTLLIQIEGALNSRPIAVLSENPDDLDPLTPGHFLIGAPLRALPELNLENQKISLRARWAHLQTTYSYFWNRWSGEYLRSLQIRPKNKTVKENVKIGEVGILLDRSLPTNAWQLCRVTNVFPGPDGHVRVIEIKTSQNSKFKRPINKFCPLPFNVIDNKPLTAGEDVRAI